MYYFKFTIPESLKSRGEDMPGYPPGWYGEMTCPPDPKRVTVMLYNEAEGYGLAQTDDEAIVAKSKGGFTVISEAEFKKLLDVKPDAARIWKGEKITTRWDAKGG